MEIVMQYEHVIELDTRDSQNMIEVFDQEGREEFFNEMRLYHLSGYHHVLDDFELVDCIYGQMMIDGPYVAWLDRDRLVVGLACAILH
jgi:hypothetical protein